MDREADTVEDAVQGDVAELQSHLAPGLPAAWELVFELSPDHQRNQFVDAGLGHG
jgi:hypothetical protein